MNDYQIQLFEKLNNKAVWTRNKVKLTNFSSEDYSLLESLYIEMFGSKKECKTCGDKRVKKFTLIAIKYNDTMKKRNQ